MEGRETLILPFTAAQAMEGLQEICFERLGYTFTDESNFETIISLVYLAVKKNEPR